MDDPAKTTPWFIRLANAVALIVVIWIAFTDGLVDAVRFVVVVAGAGLLVLGAFTLYEAIVRRYRG